MMNERAKALFRERESSDREVAYQALCGLFELTERPVDWAYEVWDELMADLEHRDGHKRAFASQMLARLAISDPDGRMLQDFPRIAAVMNDEKTVTARHTLQSIWRVALAGQDRKSMVVDALETRFRECGREKNARLVRRDVVAALGRLAKETGDDEIDARAEVLIESEGEEKERKKQRAAWRKAMR